MVSREPEGIKGSGAEESLAVPRRLPKLCSLEYLLTGIDAAPSSPYSVSWICYGRGRKIHTYLTNRRDSQCENVLYLWSRALYWRRWVGYFLGHFWWL